VSGHGIDAFSAGAQTFRAYHCLVAISGNIDRPGGNLRMRMPRGFRTYGELLHMPEFRLDEATEKRTIGADRFPLWAGPRGWQTACHNPSVIEAMLTGRPYPVRALYASGVNILVTYPDTRRTMEAPRSLDFVAVAAHAMTDIALPLLAKMAERQAIARHLLPWRSQREFNTYLLGDSGIRIEDLERTGYHQVSVVPVTPEQRPFATCTGKVELYSPALEEIGLDPLPGYQPPAQSRLTTAGASEFPLILITGDREKSYHHSRFRDQPRALKVSPDPQPTIHPETAQALGFDDGARVHVEVAGGKGPCRLASGCRTPRRRAWSIPAWAGGSRAILRRSMAPST
jgi:anaerobic selenocysteine-containing dehydrogenase